MTIDQPFTPITMPGDNQSPSPGNTAPAPLPISSQMSPAGTNNQPTQSLTFSQVENYWIQAGGSPQAAAMAAAVADSESGMNPNATRTNPDGTTSVGLWLTPQNGMPPGSTDPLASARGAVQLSNNGTDWTQWCSTWSDNNCGENNGTYLGSGSNALMSLGTQAGKNYNQFGSTPAGNGTGASTASTGVGSTVSSGSGHTIILVLGIVVAVILVIYISRKKSQEGGTGAAPRGEAVDEGASGTGIGTHTVRVPAHTRQVRNP